MITITSNALKVVGDLDEYGKSVMRQLVSIVRKYSAKAAETMKKDHLSGVGPGSVRSLSGKLRRSVKPRQITVVGDEIQGGFSVGDGLPYAVTQIGTRGRTVISVKSAGALTIPTNYAKTAKGNPRGGARDPIWGVTFISQGMIWGYQRGTARKYANPKPLFVLKQSVTVPQRVNPNAVTQKMLAPMTAEVLQVVTGGVRVQAG